MGWWTERVVPRLTHATLDNPVVAGYRARVCAGLSGDVVEIGFGTGLNLPHLPTAVRSLAAVEPSDLAWELAAEAVAASPVPVTRTDRRAESLSLDDASVDAVLVTFSLCTVQDPAAVLRQARRVLRPGGRLHFLEHGLSPDEEVQRWQRRLNPLQGRLAGGCHLTRWTPDLLEAAGFAVPEVESWYLPGPHLSRPWGYVCRGRAEPLS
ncbi:class I SAM-dependent methyltransferase [Ornithinimicrobium ciconiae]|uniref:Class I SAM-dependent methyltransferase n=1 Tax=Ornithinimicrobium ciconiae TaxID=2594265 RepID=A0A516GDX8_9MICO|nr:class I SAM-dependent methyltransferase [Ornithinimicrobium ciconiae]QDO89729.1 class I SAM-dependent methyltransferase [Ornithinimicrobium ciconiae]